MKTKNEKNVDDLYNIEVEKTIPNVQPENKR